MRHFKADWTRDEADHALGEHLLKIERPKSAHGLTFGDAIERYLKAKARKKSIKDDERHLAMLKVHFGAETPLLQITAARISEWKAQKLAATCPQTKRQYSAAAVNRPLAAAAASASPRL